MGSKFNSFIFLILAVLPELSSNDILVNLPSLVDSRGLNLLMSSAEAGNYQVVSQLLYLGFPVNFEVNGKIAVDFAWNKKYDDVVLLLLKANSFYPKDFKQSDTYGELLRYTETIGMFYKNIKNENLNQLEKFLIENPQNRTIFHLKNVSAVGTTIFWKKLNVLELLLKHQCKIYSHETFETFSKDYNKDEKRELNSILEKYYKISDAKSRNRQEARNHKDSEELVDERIGKFQYNYEKKYFKYF